MAKGDPYWMTARRDGQASDGTPIKRGDRIFWYPRSRSALVGEKAEQAARDFEAALFDDNTF